jgi:CrcB protein
VFGFTGIAFELSCLAIMKLFLLMLAGALGAATRYGLTLAIQNWLAGRGARSAIATLLGTNFPLATLLINVSGSFFLAFLTTLALHEVVKPELRLIIGTGFLGAFTTFSTFELESENLISQAQWNAATVYIAGNLLLGYAAIITGRALALRLLPTGT